MTLYVIRTRDLDNDCTFTWQRAKAPHRMGNSFMPFTTSYSVYPTLKGATRQLNFLKRITRYAFCTITVEEL